nr:ATP-binding cassette sub-family C member 10-like [Lepeophtheirus salmonis]
MSRYKKGVLWERESPSWDSSINDFGICFQSLVLVVPTHAILGIISAYYSSYEHGSYYLRPQKAIIAIVSRIIISLGLAAHSALFLLLREKYTENPDGSSLLESFVKIICWTCHAAYNYNLLHRLSLSPRGPNRILFIWILCLIPDLIQARSNLLQPLTIPLIERNLLFYEALFQNIFLATYSLTLFFGPTESESMSYQGPGERDRLWTRAQSYGGFHEEYDYNYLGVAQEDTSIMDRLFFKWVSPLIDKGRMGKLNSSQDVFDLPHNIHTGIVYEDFEFHKSRVRSLQWFRKALSSKFLKEFLCIGMIKFVADVSGFFCPLLLNRLVKFMEDPKADLRWGYFYAFSLFVSTFLVAICNTQFNFKMNELGLKVRASVIQSLYKQTLSVSEANLNKYSRGEIINFMSIDVDRVVNFAPSFHAFWSLPFQMVVTLYLLHQQVGVSSFVGVGFAILMIPINKVIATKIGSLSGHMMSAKDDRVKIIAEIIEGIRVIKYYCWESFFTDKTNSHRNDEIYYLKWRKYLDAVCVYLWASTPVIISVSTFATYSALGNPLTAAKVFTSMALFAMLSGPFNAFPFVINGLIEANVSIKRLARFLSLPSINRIKYFTEYKDENTKASKEIETKIPDIQIMEASFGFTKDCFTLRNIDVSIKRQEFVGVLGPVGSGKTTFLNAILGELEKQSGKISVRDPLSGIAYVQQVPWIQNKSIRDNILFGEMYIHGKYTKVIKACCLDHDFKHLHRGDHTIAGEKGAALSGGQKARIALARAIYQDKDIYLIDDVFSSLDVNVGYKVYTEVMLNLLKRKTRILCTHNPQYINDANIVIKIKDGEFESVKQSTHLVPTSTSPDFSYDTSMFDFKDNSNVIDDSVEEEMQETGVVAYRIYKKYWQAIGTYLAPTILISIFLMQVASNTTDLWLSHWVSTDNFQNNTEDTDHYIYVYSGLAVFHTILTLIRAFLFAYGGIHAAKIIHDLLLGVLLRAKIYFFDSTPAGRILNRFSSDTYAIDDSLPFILNIFLSQIFGVFGRVLVCVYAVPWILIVLLPLGLFYYEIQCKYRPGSRDLKRISSVSLSPIYEHFNETVHGLKIIRASKASQRFLLENEELVECNQKARYAAFSASLWLEIRLQLIGSIVVFSIALISVINFESVDAGLVGLAVSYALGMTSRLAEVVVSFTETEKELVAVERAYDYIDRIYEESYSGVLNMPYNWPNQGVVEFKDIRLRYKDHLPYVLNKVNFKTNPKEKIGIVGRTGAGKSSLIAALFRLSSFSHGEIMVDGIRIRLLPLIDFRRQFAVIPQDPFIFSGTIRQNLDPYAQHSDQELWDSIKLSYLYNIIYSFGSSGLDTLIGDGGKSLSIGQKQLLCLARAIITSAKVVFIDEATASVDKETDRLIRNVLKTAFNDKTVITIAHRIETVLNSDRIFVMSNGQIIEEGKPEDLIKSPNSEFRKLIEQK